MCVSLVNNEWAQINPEEPPGWAQIYNTQNHEFKKQKTKKQTHWFKPLRVVTCYTAKAIYLMRRGIMIETWELVNLWLDPRENRDEFKFWQGRLRLGTSKYFVFADCENLEN